MYSLASLIIEQQSARRRLLKAFELQNGTPTRPNSVPHRIPTGQESTGFWRAHQNRFAGEIPAVRKALQTGNKLSHNPVVRRAHVHQPCRGEIVQRPQSADRENDIGLSREVRARSRERLAGLVTKEDSTCQS